MPLERGKPMMVPFKATHEKLEWVWQLAQETIHLHKKCAFVEKAEVNRGETCCRTGILVKAVEVCRGHPKNYGFPQNMNPRNLGLETQGPCIWGDGVQIRILIPILKLYPFTTADLVHPENPTTFEPSPPYREACSRDVRTSS